MTVTNSGTAPLDISGISSDNTDITITPANATVAPGTTQTFDISFDPTLTGSVSASISFTHDAECIPTVLTVTGHGVSSSYQVLNTGVVKHLTGVSFIDGLRGCVTGHDGTVLFTIDGGATWTPAHINCGCHLHGVQFVGNRAFFTGSGGHICHTDDFGQTYYPYVTNTTATFYASSFFSATLGWAVGSGGTICIFDGVNWSPQPTGVSITFYGVYAIGGTAYAVGEQGTVCKYVNGGWVPVNPGVTNIFYATAFVNESFGYIVGSGGIICRTRDGGVSWEPLISGVTVDFKACKVVSPRIAYCVG
ncbi:MAG: hypothetical protein Kow0042_04230 [Calditrichia bacterium]